MDVEIKINNISLETDRIILRPWLLSDLDDFYRYASIPGVGEMAGWKHHESIEITKKILDSFIEGKNVFAIVYKENNKVIGSLGLHHSWVNEDESCKDLKAKEIGYVLSKEYWGKGLMPEAVSKVISYCFNNCGLEALTVSHFSFNKQSKRVIEKCGFKFVKTSKTIAKQLGETYDSLKYIIFNNNLEANSF
jgi:ribosomal-protein-alanine N-acetyltransferase